MRVLAIVHQDDAGPGVFADVVDDLIVWRPDRGEEPPPGFDALMVFGGAMNTCDDLDWLAPEREFLASAVRDGVPILGVCLGAQLLAEAAGGSVRRAARPEIGWVEIEADDPVLVNGLRHVFSWHSYEAVPPAGFTELASSETCLQAFRLGGAPQWGIQFHAEVSAADMRHWIVNHHTDPDAADLDPDRLWAQSEPRLAEWNQAGRDLCARFLEAIA